MIYGLLITKIEPCRPIRSCVKKIILRSKKYDDN